MLFYKRKIIIPNKAIIKINYFTLKGMVKYDKPHQNPWHDALLEILNKMFQNVS